MSKPSITTNILAALKRGERITALDAFHRWRVMRLSSIIFNLRQAGHAIETELVRTGKGRFAVYFIA